MKSDEQVVFDVELQTNSAGRSLSQLTNQISQAAGQWDNSINASSANMQSAMSKAFDIERVKNWALEAGKWLVKFGQEAIGAASDLREVQNVVDVTFGESAGEIERWAKTAQTQFGLTEVQAKQFTSTLGAMMKSAGMAGPEIVSMSTDLAGLAADMASFYNLDFDTAFQKIRSGISGETEPLKQLGINMSVANLEAYALTQGITKSFEKMSQGEQTMLRYQYLMQATADAQGDFARTSEGYANAQRRLETSLDSIKTTFGNFLLTVIEPATAGLATFLEDLTTPPERTIFDDFNEIDVQTEAKIAQIEEVAAQATALTMTLEDIGSKEAGEALSDMASGANALNSESPRTWTSLLNTLSAASGVGDLFTQDNAATNVESLAAALSGSAPDVNRAQAWQQFFGALSENAEAMSTLTGTSPEETKTWLTSLATAAGELDPEDAEAWDTLLSSFVGGLPGLADSEAGLAFVESFALNANKLNSSSPGVWKSLMTALSGATGIDTLFTNNNIAGNVEGLATALSGMSPDTNRAQAWSTFLGALSDNAESLTELTGKNPEETRQWLSSIATAANQLDPNKADGWDRLLSTFIAGLPGLEDTEEGKAFARFMETQEQYYLSLGTESEEGQAGLKSLGYSTDEITHKQELWLETLKRLVATIPGLSELVNLNTGEIYGGVQALQEYIRQWESGEKKLAFQSAYQQRQAVLQERYNQLFTLELDARVAQRRSRLAIQDVQSLYDKYGLTVGIDANGNVVDQSDSIYGITGPEKAEIATAVARANAQVAATKSAVEAYKNLNAEIKEAEAAQSEYLEFIDGVPEGMDAAADATNRAAAAMTELVKAAAEGGTGSSNTALTQIKKQVEETAKAFDALADYVEKTQQDIHKALLKDSGGLFETVVTPWDKALAKYEDIKAKLVKQETGSGKNKKRKYTDDEAHTQAYKQAGMGEAVKSMEGMLAGLESQRVFMEKYESYLNTARELGLSDELLAELSDGSAESFDYLRAIAEAAKKNPEQAAAQVGQLNEAYKALTASQTSLEENLLNTKLTTDEAYDALVNKANESLGKLQEMVVPAYRTTADVMDQITGALAAGLPGVTTGVDAIVEQMNRLTAFESAGIKMFGSVGTSYVSTGKKGGSKPIGSHAAGLDFVPFDGYLSALHEGEGILTREENRVWQDFKNGLGSNANALDYDALGGVMRDNVRAGGNVYLDGQTVGRVISGRQADAYRALERSGWQA